MDVFAGLGRTFEETKRRLEANITGLMRTGSIVLASGEKAVESVAKGTIEGVMRAGNALNREVYRAAETAKATAGEVKSGIVEIITAPFKAMQETIEKGGETAEHVIERGEKATTAVIREGKGAVEGFGHSVEGSIKAAGQGISAPVEKVVGGIINMGAIAAIGVGALILLYVALEG